METPVQIIRRNHTYTCHSICEIILIKRNIGDSSLDACLPERIHRALLRACLALNYRFHQRRTHLSNILKERRVYKSFPELSELEMELVYTNKVKNIMEFTFNKQDWIQSEAIQAWIDIKTRLSPEIKEKIQQFYHDHPNQEIIVEFTGSNDWTYDAVKKEWTQPHEIILRVKKDESNHSPV